ncbi:hypothetical protein HAX54_022019, partial [Datura stramonium]|nr:hypothetical protein [Datura stramonium]
EVEKIEKYALVIRNDSSCDPLSHLMDHSKDLLSMQEWTKRKEYVVVTCQGNPLYRSTQRVIGWSLGGVELELEDFRLRQMG